MLLAIECNAKYDVGVASSGKTSIPNFIKIRPVETRSKTGTDRPDQTRMRSFYAHRANNTIKKSGAEVVGKS
jgi:hypothetical protein